MSKRFLTNLDLSKNQILNVAIQNLATAPSSPVLGQIYYNTVDARMYFWDGSAWVDMSGDIQDVLGGNGLSASTSADGDVITLSVNVDGSTIEINADTVRIKDLGVTTAKLNDAAVTTAKINDAAVTTVKIGDNNVTFAKIQTISTGTVLGNVSGSTGNVAEVSIIQDLASGALSTNLASSAAIKTYVDGKIGGLGNLEGAWDASSGSFPVGSAPVSGTKAGDYWYVTVAGTVDSVSFNVGDVIIAKVDNASTSTAANWIQLEVNRDQATTTVLGVVRLATTAEAQALSNTVAAITPATLGSVTATETRTGLAELATQAETDAGTDDARIVTPLKLKTLLDNRTGGYAANMGNGSATSFAITHSLNTVDVIVMIKDNSTLEEVFTDVVITDVNTVTVSFATAPTTNAYRVIIKK